jgi:hypothetical protein
MAVLITVGNSEGDRRCDAKCYNAEGDKCDCVCGGMNHGAGLSKALVNTADHAEQISERLHKLVESGQASRYTLGDLELGL